MMGNKAIGWNMLDSYREGQAIYGRDTEILTITESINYNIQTFIYGKSGIGKTSLIQAGIFPKLRELKFFPVNIRLSFYGTEPLKDVVKRLVKEEAERENSEIGKVSLKCNAIEEINYSDCSLYDFFNKVKFEDNFNTPYIPILIFDQFEENINNEKNWQKTVDFIKNELYGLIDNSYLVHGNVLTYTNYRIVFSMREDYLYCMEDIIDTFSLWELRYNRYRIKALDDKKAKEVIISTYNDTNTTIENQDKVIDTIINIIKMNSGTRFTEINTALLSLICSLLYENATNGCIRYTDLRKITASLNSYYDNIFDNPTDNIRINHKTIQYLEKTLITSDGRRSSIDELEAIKSKKITKKELEYLVKKHLLKQIKTDNTSIRYEFVHDLFAKMIYKRTMDSKKYRFTPKYYSISKSIRKYNFLKEVIYTTSIIVLLTLSYLTFHFYNKHYENTENPFNILPCFNNVLFIGTFTLLWYLVPLYIKRLHDINKSGWFIIFIPITIFTLCIEKIFPSLNYSHYLKYIGLFCFVIYIAFLFLTRGTRKYAKRELSSDYESAFNGSSISYSQYIKFLILEAICYIISYTFSCLIYCYAWDINLEQVITNTLPLPLLDKLGLVSFSVPAIIALLPIVLSFSTAFKSRVRSVGIGRNSWYIYIPYINVILATLCLLPDSLLKAMQILKPLKQKNNNEDDNVLLNIYDDFKNNTIQYDEYNNVSIAKLTWIPFYALIKVLNTKTEIQDRCKAVYYCSIHLFLYYMFIGIPLFIYSIYNELYSYFLISIFILIYFCLGIICISIIKIRLKYNLVIDILTKNPYYTIDNIKEHIGKNNLAIYHWYQINRAITKLTKKGIITRIEKDEEFQWVINKKK